MPSQVGLLLKILFLISTTYNLSALPGDNLFYDDFERSSLGSDWTTTDTDRSGIGTYTSNSGTRSLYTRHNVVTVTTRDIPLNIDGAKLQIWIRRGEDSFSEDPDYNEDFIIEFFDEDGSWQEIDTYLGNGTAGEIINLDYQLPLEALHNTFKLRVRQLGGSGNDWDYWHIDDVNITETGYVYSAQPLEVGQCDDFEGDLSNWIVSSSRVNITNATANSPTHSLSLNGGNVDATSIDIDTSNNFKELTIWIRRGKDSFSEDPDPNEDLIAEYYNSSGSWVELETFLGSGTKGEIYERTYAMPSDAKHATFKIRLRMTNGSGNGWDYWHVDDVCLIPDRYLTIQKSSCIINDPINGTTNPKRIPGSTIRYTIEVANLTGFITEDVITKDDVSNKFDISTIRNLQIKDGYCDCLGTSSASNNGANGTGNGVNPLKLDFDTIDKGTVKHPRKECGYFEVDIK